MEYDEIIAVVNRLSELVSDSGYKYDESTVDEFIMRVKQTVSEVQSEILQIIEDAELQAKADAACDEHWSD